MKNLIFLMISILLILMFGCEKVNKITMYDSNEDLVYHLEVDEGLGNFSFSYDYSHKELTTRNFSANHAGFQATEQDEPNVPIVGVPLVRSGEEEFSSNVYMKLDEWYEGKCVYYIDGLGWIFIEAITLAGLHFVGAIEEWMVQDTYEVVFRFREGSREAEIKKVRRVQNDPGFKQNSENNTMVKLFQNNRDKIEKVLKSENNTSDIKNFEDFVQEFQRVKSLNQ